MCVWLHTALLENVDNVTTLMNSRFKLSITA